jgi:hypothetical protein
MVAILNLGTEGFLEGGGGQCSPLRRMQRGAKQVAYTFQLSSEHSSK